VLPRLLVFAGLSEDPGVRFNLDQALTAIGSGGYLAKAFSTPAA